MGGWVRADLARSFKEAAMRQQVDMSGVIRNAIVSFVAQDREERAMAASRNGKEKKLARRMFRVLLGVMSPKEVLEDVLKLVPAHQVDKILKLHRGEKD